MFTPCLQLADSVSDNLMDISAVGGRGAWSTCCLLNGFSDISFYSDKAGILGFSAERIFRVGVFIKRR